MIPEEWTQITLEDFVSLQRGYDLPDHERALGNVPILGSFGITGYHDAARVKGPGLTVGLSGGSFGVVVFSVRDFWPLNTTLFVTDFHGNDVRFAYYLLKSIDFKRYDSGSAQPSLNRNYIRTLQLTVPPLSEQRAIAHILGALDDKIELNRRMNETLEAIARAIFKSWFVDFDPVRAKAESRKPFGMDAETALLFPNSFQDSTTGRIPSGWEIGLILSNAKLLSGGTPKTDRSDYWNGDILWASAKDVSQCPGAFLIGTERTITDKGLAGSATQIIPAFCTVIVARGATTGRMVLLGRDMAMNQTCYAVSTTINAPFFLYCLLRNEIASLVHTAHGSVFDTITTSTFSSHRVVSPPKAIVEAFESEVAPIFKRILANILESSTIGAIRHALLPKLICGEIRAKEQRAVVETDA